MESSKKAAMQVELVKRFLYKNNGCAFHIEPHKGILKPWCEVLIKVVSYNNLVGIYTDELVCKTAERVQTFPVRLGVSGSTIKISGTHLISREKEVKKGGIDVEKINFGARIIELSDKASKELQIITNPTVSNDHGQKGCLPKIIQINNLSPRPVLLKWSLFILHRAAESAKDNLQVINTQYGIKDILKMNNLVAENEVGIFQITPTTMAIPAFGSMPITCNFNNELLGTFEALAVSEIAYYQNDGTYKYAPEKSTVPGVWPSVEQQTNAYFNPQGIVNAKDLSQLAIFGIKSRCIEPKLSLEGERSYIRVKIKGTGSLATQCKVVAFVNNLSDAICEFKVEASPTNLFKVTPSTQFQQFNSDYHELHQKQQLLLNVEFLYANMGLVNCENVVDSSNLTRIEGKVIILFSNGMVQYLVISAEIYA